MWYRRKIIILNNLSYLLLSFYSIICSYILGIFFASLYEKLHTNYNTFISFIIPLGLTVIISGYLLNQNRKMKRLAGEENEEEKYKLTLFDWFEYKNPQYLMMITKYGYTLWIFYIFLVLYSDKLSTISFGLSDYFQNNYYK